MENYSFKVISPRSGRNKQVDLFFISLANAMGAKLVLFSDWWKLIFWVNCSCCLLNNFVVFG
jgi:hypothetical protein